MRPKIHADELAASGGTAVGVSHGAVSVDHLEQAGDAELALLAGSQTIATMLPGASFFSNLPYAPARRALAAGCRVALASDYNPGSSPSGDMRFIWSLGCIKMKLTPEQALTCCTATGAAAMGLDNHGLIAPRYRADFILTRPLTDLALIPYQYTTPYIRTLYLAGTPLSVELDR